MVHLRIGDREYRAQLSNETLATIEYDDAVAPYELVVRGTDVPPVLPIEEVE